MGAGDSKINNNDYNKSRYEKFISSKYLKELSEDHLRLLLKPLNNQFIEKIIDKFISNSCLSEDNFEELYDYFTFKSSGNLFIKICDLFNVASLDNDLIELILLSMTFNHDSNINLYIMNNIDKNCQDEDNNYVFANIESYLDRNLPDYGLDMCQYVVNILNVTIDENDSICDLHLSYLKRINSQIINCTSLSTLLLACLPYLFKSSYRIFSFTQLSDWCMLFSNSIHGVSNSVMREKCFGFPGPVLMLINADDKIFCLATDNGFKEDFDKYGSSEARFYQISPNFQKYISGPRVSTKTNGVIYSHFTTKSGKRGIYVGHGPINNAAAVLNEDINVLQVLGQDLHIKYLEIWAVGSNTAERHARYFDVRKWEQKEVEKNKNRKIKVDDWKDSPDRELLNWGGVNVKNTDNIGNIDHKEN